MVPKERKSTVRKDFEGGASVKDKDGIVDMIDKSSFFHISS